MKEGQVKHAIVLVALLTLPTLSWGRDKKLVPVKVEVVDQAEGMQGSVQGAGIVGAAVGRRVVTDAWTVRVIVKDEHILLTCYENHHACHFLGVGTYDGELKTHPPKQEYAGYGKPTDPDIWIHYIRPIDHVDIREHWKVTGSW
jgi:hypothetical protein